MIAAAVAALLGAATASATPPLTPAAAFIFGVSRICLPKAKGADVDKLADQLKLRPVPSALLPNRTAAGDRGWYLPTVAPVLAISWANGSCSVQYLKGDPAPVAAAMHRWLSQALERFSAGLTEAPAAGLMRTTYCGPQRPFPLAVTLTLPTAGARNRMAVSSTVIRSRTPGEPSFCSRRDASA